MLYSCVMQQSQVASLEQNFERMTEKHAVAIAPEISVLQCGLQAWLGLYNIPPAAEIIVSGLVDSSVILNCLALGLVVKFADIDLDTLQPTVRTIQAAKTPQTVAVLVSHHGGYPCSMDELWDWCKARRCVLIDDASEALPCRYKKWANGSWPSDMTYFRCGAGGVVCLKDQRWADRVRSRGKIEDAVANDVATCVERRMGQYSRRSEIFAQYSIAFEDLDTVELPWSDSKQVQQSCFRYPFRVDGDREQVAAQLINKTIHLPLRYLPASEIQALMGKVPVLMGVDDFCQREVSLPICGRMTPAQVKQVIDEVKRAV